MKSWNIFLNGRLKTRYLREKSSLRKSGKSVTLPQLVERDLKRAHKADGLTDEQLDAAILQARESAR